MSTQRKHSTDPVTNNILTHFFDQGSLTSYTPPMSEYYQEAFERLCKVETAEPLVKPSHTPKLKQCYDNALMVSRWDESEHGTPDFVFGYLIYEEVPLPIMHAWNAVPVNGDYVHFDVTMNHHRPEDADEHHYFELMKVAHSSLEKIIPEHFWDQHIMRLFHRAATEEVEGVVVPQKRRSMDRLMLRFF